MALTATFVPVIAARCPAYAVGPAAVPKVPAGERTGIDTTAVVEQVERQIAATSAGQRVGPALPVSPPAGAPGLQREPDVAFDGTNFLVVWTSDMASVGGFTTIAAARVTPTGQLLDPNGILLPEVPGTHRGAPTVAFGNGGYLIAYEEDWIVKGLRVGTDGQVQGAPFPISDGVSTVPGSFFHLEIAPALAFNGTVFLAVWQEEDFVDTPTGSVVQDDIAGARISATTVLDPGGRFISQAANRQTAPDVASDGSGFLVTWADRRLAVQPDVFAARVDGAGAVLDPAGIPVAGGTRSQNEPAVAFGATDYLIAWTDGREFGDDIAASRVTPAGVVVDATPIDVSVAPGKESNPALGFDGTNFVATWQDARALSSIDVYGTSISQTGTVLRPAGTPIATADQDQALPAIAGGSDVSFVAWGDPGSGGDVWGTRLDGDGTVLDTAGLLVSVGDSSVGTAGSAFNGNVTLVAWRADPTAPSTILATRVRPDGTVVDPRGILVGGNVQAGSTPPSVATDGQNFLLTYSGGEAGGCQVAVAIISGTTGEILADGPVTQAASCERPAVAFDGTNYVVVTHAPVANSNLRATVVSPNGTVINGFDLTTDQANVYDADVAGIEGAVLVAWRNGAVLVSDLGPVTPVALPPALTEGDTAVASNGDGFLVTRMTAGGLVSTRVDADGTVLDPTGIPVSGSGGQPRVAFNGTWLIVWNDRRTTGAGPGIYGARIQTDGTVLNPSGFIIAPGVDVDPAVSARPDGRGWTVAYPGFDAATESNRMFVRLVAPK